MDTKSIPKLKLFLVSAFRTQSDLFLIAFWVSLGDHQGTTMRRKHGREKVVKGSLSMYDLFWQFADSRVETEKHNSVAAYIVDRIRRHMDEITNFSRQVGTSGPSLGLSSQPGPSSHPDLKSAADAEEERGSNEIRRRKRSGDK